MDLGAALRFARRELRGGLRGFRVFLACLALGVAGIAGVGSVVAAIEGGLEAEGRALLGGDVEVELTYRFATDEERARLDALGDVSEVVDFRSMARATPAEGPETAAVVQAKAVDAAYPLVGEAVLAPAMPLPDALARGADGAFGAVADLAMATKLGVQVGDRVRFGREEFELRAILESEPDRVAAGFAFGPRFMISTEALEETGLVQPGTLFETQYRVRLDRDAAALEPLKQELLAEFEEAGWRWRDRRAGAPGVEDVVGRIGAFLTLVGLASLAVGGVGVGASVRAYLDGKTETIATLKTLGADGATVLWTYLFQIAALTLLGVAIGLVIGGGAPLLLAPILAANLPVPADFGVYPAPLLEAALYGSLVAFLFALWPLARAQEVRAAGLFRDLVAPERAWPKPLALLAMAALGGGLALAATVFTGAPRLALAFVAALAVALLALVAAAQLVGLAARALARSRLAKGRLALRLALSTVGGGGERGETRGAVLALGLGLTVLTSIGLIDVNLRRFVSDQLPATAPAYFFVDVQNAELPRFRDAAEALPGVERIETAPMLRGVISRINGVSSREWAEAGNVSEDFEWVLRGDRGVTYAATQPRGTEIVEGAWWEDDYAGPPLVSFGEEQARGLGIGVGDTVTVNVFGRDITAEIASLRRVEFRDGGINFLMVFTPSVLAGAPHAHIATLYGEEPVAGDYLRALGAAFPTVTGIRSQDFLARIESVLSDLAAAARAGAVATLVTGLVVLIGAAAAGQRRRIYEAAVLKTLGATRGALLTALTLRSALLGLAAASVALVAGGIAAWAVVTFVFEGAYRFDLATGGLVAFGGLAATLATGAAFALGPLSARPARVLRGRD